MQVACRAHYATCNEDTVAADRNESGRQGLLPAQGPARKSFFVPGSVPESPRFSIKNLRHCDEVSRTISFSNLLFSSFKIASCCLI